MGAVWGFTGTPNWKLNAVMAAHLTHRGNALPSTAATTFGTISHVPPVSPGRVGVVSAEIHHFDYLPPGFAIAMCGFITSVDHPLLARELSPGVVSEHFYRTLAERFALEGPSIFSKITGAYIFAIRCGSKLHIVRDGAGARTAVYGRYENRWLFSIEPKSLHKLPGFSKIIRPAALAQYLACSFVPGGGTMLEDIWEVPAGHLVTLEQGKEPILTRWFHFEEEEAEREVLEFPSRNGDAVGRWVKEFRAEMERAVAERLPRSEPVGVFLSGGLDSSLVTAELARQIGGKNIKTFAIHFGEKYPHELDFARAVAERCGTVHREVLIRPQEFLPALRKMIWHLDDPIGDPITQPNFELAGQVSNEVRFVFNGEGGDPCFGGPKNIPMLLSHWYGGIEREANFRERRYLESYRRAYEEIEVLLSEDVRRAIDPVRDLVGMFRPFFQSEKPRQFLNKLMAINIREKGARLILPKVERMTAAWGVTPLSPLFDERLLRLSFRMPAGLKLHAGIEKYILKRAYENELPKEVIDRPKSGMRVPVHYWFRSEMRRYARQILRRRDILQSGLFDPARIKQLLAYDIESGRGRYGLRLWMLITFEIWRRIVVESESP